MTTTQANAPRQIPTRRISFDESLQDLPKHFAGDGDIIASHIVAGLSAVFPDGEDFFVRSVRNFRSEITDPDLKKQVNGFIGQEAMHGREHRAFNDRLAELGYPTKLVERITKTGLEFREKVASPKMNLAATAALEHFTATLAELVLTSEETRTLIGHEAVQELFAWHALEESEHKAVAFDVYKAIGGSERMRVWTMNFFRYGFLVGMTIQIVASMLFDRSTYNPRRLWKSLRNCLNSPVVDRELWRQLKDYNRPDFHPDDRDTTALVAEWSEKLFGADGTLNDKLAGASAA